MALRSFAGRLPKSGLAPRSAFETPGTLARPSGDRRRFAAYERVHHVRLWLEELRIGRELSQTLKLRRQVFLRLYACEIDELHAP